MGKAGRWLRNLFPGAKHSSAQPSSSSSFEEKKTTKEKKRWSFVKSSKHSTATTPPPKEERRGSYREPSSGFESDPNKHAIAVAAATAAVAEAAVAAAQAAAAVVRLTASSVRCASETAGTDWRKREEWAALRIQSAFRGYLARRALSALKALVKLQALVRGHIVRKQAAATLRSMQALVRVQARARTHRSLSSTDVQQPFSHFQHSHTGDPLTPEKRDARNRGNRSRQDLSNNKQMNSTKSTKAESDQTNSGRSWIDRWVDNRSNYTIPATSGDDECAKILEVDPGKPSTVSSRRRKKSLRSSQSARAASSDRNSQSYTTVVLNSPSRDSTTAQLSTASHSSVDMPVNPLGLPPHDDESEYIYGTADNSPQYYSASSLHLVYAGEKRGPNSASMKSDDVQSFVDGYSGYCPSYMANTESSKAKARRSQSAPKQRPEFEKLSGSTKRLSTYSYPDVVVRSSSSSTTLTSQRSLVHSRFTSKAYPGSGMLDRLGMPVNVRGSNCTDVGYRY